MRDATLYDGSGSRVGDVHAMFITFGEPDDVGLPARPVFPGDFLRAAWMSALMTAIGLCAAVGGAFLL